MKKMFVILIAVFMLAGCSSRQPSSGFLGEQTKYAELQEDPTLENAKVWRKPGVGRIVDNYDAVIVAPVELWLPQETIENSNISLEELQMLAQFFHDALVRELSKVTKVVDKPGPRVLRIELAITYVKETDKVMNAITSVVPVGVVVSYTSRAVTGKHTNVGEIAIEAIGRDSMSGEVVGMYSDVKSGGKYSSANYERLGQAKSAIDEWAETMRKRFEERARQNAK
ncbi:DUF3313 domain-containing protein [Halodesulfovibrio marinisediminis]|uniref:Lipoprotein n=1 Tax=Halodesulfovibrio marinisediminis DSM 17456 TaxID=1121457 RepID=A0A1N6GWF5_9BACT|nr:DUF3313 family protein [Halodesulfovibrio marinisediminis]SIO11792.1 Protein of unknown function [Halodesulfovibrio marinisediminis DSM 17456]